MQCQNKGVEFKLSKDRRIVIELVCEILDMIQEFLIKF